MGARGQAYGEVIDGQGCDKWQGAGYIWPNGWRDYWTESNILGTLTEITLDKIIHRTRMLYIITWQKH